MPLGGLGWHWDFTVLKSLTDFFYKSATFVHNLFEFSFEVFKLNRLLDFLALDPPLLTLHLFGTDLTSVKGFTRIK